MKHGRRAFISTVAAGSAGLVASSGLAAAAQSAPGPILKRRFGKHPDLISALGMGGHHLGNAASLAVATDLVHAAVDGGITFFDNAWEYNNHRSEEWLGAGLAGLRDKVFLMTKVCTHGRSANLGMQMLEESLKRLRTDHLDLWQIHAVVYDNDPDLAYRKGGIVEAMDLAKRQGKVRYTGFTGHKDPHIHKRMLDLGYPFDAIQFPINPFDAQFRSFQQLVLPDAVKRGMAVLGMKPFGGQGQPFHDADVKMTPQQALRYAMSVPGVTTTITGMESMDVLRQNLAIAQNFQPMSAAEMGRLVADVAPQAGDGHLEVYKTSLQYDDFVTRQVHEMPLSGANA
jgi:aryl-alcohol dehydrogenase-like predicted oxidoreductase